MTRRGQDTVKLNGFGPSRWVYLQGSSPSPSLLPRLDFYKFNTEPKQVPWLVVAGVYI